MPSKFETFSCPLHSLIFCIRCNFCNKLYIGQTDRQLVDWFSNYLQGIWLHMNIPITDLPTTLPLISDFGIPLLHRSIHSQLCLEQHYTFCLQTHSLFAFYATPSLNSNFLSFFFILFYAILYPLIFLHCFFNFFSHWIFLNFIYFFYNFVILKNCINHFVLISILSLGFLFCILFLFFILYVFL